MGPRSRMQQHKMPHLTRRAESVDISFYHVMDPMPKQRRGRNADCGGPDDVWRGPETDHECLPMTHWGWVMAARRQCSCSVMVCMLL